MTDTPARYMAAMNKLAKIRTLLTGWQLGTRVKGDPEADAVRDHREQSVITRVEVTALVGLLIKKGVITQEQLQVAVIDEADQLARDYERRFPGVQITDHGLVINPVEAEGWMRNWKP